MSHASTKAVLEAARWNLTTTTRACVRFCAWTVAHSLGYFKPEYTPTYRGFDSFFGFYTGGETHYSHITPHGGPGEFGPGADPNQLDGLCHGQQGLGCSTWTPQHGATHPPGYSGSTCYLFDLSNNSGTTLLPADRSLNGTFSTELYAKEATRLIAHHAALYPASGGSAAAGSAKPFYMYLAWHVVHMPLEAPAAAELDEFESPDDAGHGNIAGRWSRASGRRAFRGSNSLQECIFCYKMVDSIHLLRVAMLKNVHTSVSIQGMFADSIVPTPFNDSLDHYVPEFDCAAPRL